MSREAIITPQPKPKPGKQKVKHLVIDHLTAESESYAEVALDCVYKMEASEVKYGSPLMTHNGRSADLDAYQDLLDTINYQVQAYYEEKDSFLQEEIRQAVNHLAFVALKIRRRLVYRGIISKEE